MRSEVKGQTADTKSQIDGQAGPELETLRSETEPQVPEGLEARVIGRVHGRAEATRPAPLRGWRFVLARIAAVLLVVFGVWLGTRLGNGICGSKAQQYEQMLAEEGL